MNWKDFPFRINMGRACRLMYGDGPCDWLDLPAPIMDFAAGPWGVTIWCADGGLYLLWSTTTPEDVYDGWTVQLLIKK